MDSIHPSDIAVAIIVGKVGYGYVVNWWKRRNLHKKYIKVAEDDLNLTERITNNDNDDHIDIEDVLATVDIEERTPVRRRVRHRGLFRSYLIQVGKAKFGTPTRTAANTMCVRKFLYDECVSHGVLARHIVDNLDFAVEAVYVPSRSELLAKAVRHTKLAEIRSAVGKKLDGPTSSD